MMVDRDADLHERLRAAGLDELQATTYLALLRQPMPISAAGASVGSQEKADRLFHELRSFGLVGVARVDGEQSFYALDPDLAWLVVSAEVLWSHQASLAPITELPSATDPRVERHRRAVERARQAAIRVYVRPPSIKAVVHGHSHADLIQLSVGVIESASNRIDAVSKSPRLAGLSQFWAALTSKLEAGAKYHRVTAVEEVFEHGLDIVERDVNVMGIDLRLLPDLAITKRFIISDAPLLLVYEKVSASGRGGAAKLVDDKFVIRRYRGHFRKAFGQGVPALPVVRQIRRLAVEAIESANVSRQVADYSLDVLAFGRFSTFDVVNNWAPEQLRRIRAQAVEAGLCRVNATGHYIANVPSELGWSLGVRADSAK